MNRIFTIAFLLTLLYLTSYGQETSLYNNQGEAVAYIDFDEDGTIFLWDGTPVAFMQMSSDDICIFGFNGSFLGWYEEGVVYDRKGYVVGARKGVMNMTYRIERYKGIQKMSSIRPITPITPIKPIWKLNWSSASLLEFLYFGKK